MRNFIQWLQEVTNPDKLLGKHANKDPKDLNMSNIFGTKRRLLISSDGTEDPSAQFIRLVKDLTNHHLTPEEIKQGFITQIIKTQQGDKQRNVAIGTLLSKHKRQDLLDLYSTVKDKINNTSNEDYSIIISREPTDILRMSDHVADDGSKIQSCHSPGGGWFRCAVKEAKVGGAVAYAVKTEDLNNIKLNDKEIFTDNDRNQKGITPLERLRLRRFTDDQGNELLIPELRSYPLTKNYKQTYVKGFKEAVTKWAQTTQEATIQHITQEYKTLNNAFKKFALRGGAYQDNDADEIWSTFFNQEFSGSKTSIDQSEDGDKTHHLTPDEWLDNANEWLTQRRNKWQNDENINLDIDVNDNGQNDATGKWGGFVEWMFPQTTFLKLPTENNDALQFALRAFIRKRGYGIFDNFRIRMGKTNVFVEGNLVKDNDGSLYDFEHFLDEMSDLDQDYDDLEDMIKVVLEQYGHLRNHTHDTYQENNYKHFKLFFDHHQRDHYTLKSEQILLGSIKDVPSHYALINYSSGYVSLAEDMEKTIFLPMFANNQFKLTLANDNMTDGLSLNSLTLRNEPLPDLPLYLHFEWGINRQVLNTRLYAQAKQLDDQWERITQDLQKWWQKFIPNAKAWLIHAYPEQYATWAFLMKNKH